ncbi:hypothetical protein IAR50_003210 [Cryptococcus sp. DSM 104548]
MSSTSSHLIAITGINGFIATEVVLNFLSRGWSVRGSVRTPAQAANLKTLPAYEPYFASGQLEVVVVTDLAKSDYSELLDGVDAVASVAAPLPKFDKPDLTWDDFKGPTIEPVLRILQYAQKSTTIKSVALMTSSVSSFDLEAAPGRVITETDWNPYTEEFAESINLATNPMAPVFWYFVAKKLAELAVIEYQKTENPSFSIAIICPAMVYGPAHQIPSLAGLKAINGSSDEFFGLFSGKEQALPPLFGRVLVDSRDVAEAFHAAITKQVSGKFLLSAHEFDWQTLADKLRKLRPDLDAYIPLGEPEKKYMPLGWSVDTSKAKKELGLEYRSIEDTLTATTDFYETLGLFKEEPVGSKKTA